MTPYVGPAFLVLCHKDVEGGLRGSLQLAILVLLPLPILRTLWLNHPWWPLFSYDHLFTLGRLSLRWLNQDLLPIELNHVHIRWEQVFIELYLGTFYKFQSSFVYGRLNLSMKNIAVISSMSIRIRPFSICMFLSCSDNGMT
jgi:hypothetical protein